MSPVMSRSPAEGVADDCTLEQLEVNGKKLYWLDEMLGGGFEIPEDLWDTPDKTPSFLLLLGGPPGTGKTTFALELCYNLARNDQPKQCPRKIMREKPWTSLYVSLETPGKRIIENAKSFGWQEDFFNYLNPGNDHFPAVPELESLRCNILGNEHFRGTADAAFNPANNFWNLVQGYLRANPRDTFRQWASLIGRQNPPEDQKILHELYRTIFLNQPDGGYPPDVLVIDSLNLLWPQQPASEQAHPATPVLGKVPPRNMLETFYQIIGDIGGGRVSKRPKLLIVIVDSFAGDGAQNPWEYLADAAIRFDWAIGQENYHSRSFQINKIKTQTHALGNNHVFKIVPRATADATNDPPPPVAGNDPPPPVAGIPVQVLPRTRGIPYLETGGTYVFPSVHWHLSGAIRENLVRRFNRAENYRSGLVNMDTILQGTGPTSTPGFPRMHTTALTGRRGGMKSHLAYHFMLSHALGISTVNCETNQQKNVLLISLRDDIDSARDTLARLIEQQQFAAPGRDSDAKLNELLQSDRLEILYNWPGCVTPNEFFHRIFVALARKRKPDPLYTSMWGQAEIVVVNGLDHLDVKFPLVTGDRVFVPGLESLFRCFKVCSVVVSGDDRPGSLQDIRPLADLILDFSDYIPVAGLTVDLPQGTLQTSRVTAVRVPAGQLGGLWGVLGRDATGRMDFYRDTQRVI